MEHDLGIAECSRWKPNDAQWQENQHSENQWEFLEALDQLEVACVARNFEKEKMNRANTGQSRYGFLRLAEVPESLSFLIIGAHQRQNIHKNMQERSKTVKSRIDEVNRLGQVIGLRPNLVFESVTGDDIRQLFVILGSLRPEGTAQPTWTRPACRSGTISSRGSPCGRGVEAFSHRMATTAYLDSRSR